jgi:DNA-binding transcriptional LysR family regulator
MHTTDQMRRSSGAAMDLPQIEAFLTLAEELHFGRAAQRLYVSQSMVSRRVTALEREVGGALFERTSRRVRLTPLGEQLRDRFQPAYHEIYAALTDASTSAKQIGGFLRVGVTATTAMPALTRVVEAFRDQNPDCQVSVDEIEIWDPLGALRSGAVDVIVNWLAIDEPDLTIGPPISYHQRVLAVARNHRLANQESVSIEDLANEKVHAALPSSFPTSLLEAFSPAQTPSGRPIHRHEEPVDSISEVAYRVSLGEIVQPTTAGPTVFAREDIVLVPIRDLPPIPLGLIWCTSHTNARIRDLAKLVKSLAPASVASPREPKRSV